MKPLPIIACTALLVSPALAAEQQMDGKLCKYAFGRAYAARFHSLAANP